MHNLRYVNQHLWIQLQNKTNTFFNTKTLVSFTKTILN